jgi:excinuclease ABC subunit C
MEEAVRRRFEKLKKEGQEFPDLVILDGGKGQLKAGLQALRELGLSLPIAGLAKRFEEIFLPGAEEPRRPEGPALYLLQRIRDEAHRFAVGYHRLLRGKRMVRSILDDIEGIGPTRRKKLLASFGSVESMREAKIGDFLRAGLPNEVAVRLFRYLQGED